MTDWDTSFEANPANTENISQGAERIRTFKEVARETIAVDHYLVPAGTMADNGKHNKATLIKQGSAPASAADQGVVFSAAGAGDSSDTTELFYIDSAGRSRQLTWEGSAPFPINTRMYFYQDEAPDGWLFESTSGDRVLIGAATVGAGGYTYNDETNGGKEYSWNLSEDTGHGSANIWRKTEGHALAVTEMPRHSHQTWIDLGRKAHDASGSTVALNTSSGPQPTTTPTGPPNDDIYVTRMRGGAEDADLEEFVEAAGVAHTHNGWGDGTWRPSASIVILCKKLF